MSIENARNLEEEIVLVLKKYSSRGTIAHDQLIGRDVGIYGGDGVQILYELEDRFKVDLKPLIDSVTVFRPPNWLDRLRGRKEGPAHADLTVGQLIEYIVNETRRQVPEVPR